MSLLFRANSFVTRHTPVKLVRSKLSRPVASVSFDDFPRSAWTEGGPIVQAHGARATYYAAGRYCGAREDGIDYYDAADLKALLAAGHEVGAPRFAHQMAPELSTLALLADAAKADAVLGPLLDARMSSYAYPYGAVSPRTKAVMGARYASARGIRAGVNTGLIDLAQLKAVPIESRRWVSEDVDAAVTRAAETQGWAIFFTHDVSEHPTPFGCTPAMLEHVMARITAAGIETLPVRQAMARAVFGEG